MKKWLMRLILSPGAYMVWHALGNPEEWEPRGEYCIENKPTGVQLWMGNGAWFFDEWNNGDKTGALGLFERHLVHPRAKRVRRVWLRRAKRAAKEAWKLNNPNHNLFLKMTQLTGKQ